LQSLRPQVRLGLLRKGHLGVGADADVTVYQENPDGDLLFEYPRYVIKGGEVVIEEGEIRTVINGRQYLVQPDFDKHIEEYLRPLFQKVYTISFDNYPVELERIAQPEIRPCK
jgi:formylmethanofuran dehydrogenase subunit A